MTAVQPLKRSRLGCVTCRRRHKKCDEVFEDGSCQRCHQSGYECVFPPAELRTRYSGRTYAPAKRARKDAESASSPPETSLSARRASSPAEVLFPPGFAMAWPLGPAGSLDEAMRLDGSLQLMLGSFGTGRTNVSGLRVELTWDWNDPKAVYDRIQDTWLSGGSIQYRVSMAPALRDLSSRSVLTLASRDAVVHAFRSRIMEDGAKDSELAAAAEYDLAVCLLNSVASQCTLEVQLHTICDLQLYNFTVSGAALCYAALDLGASLVRAVYGATPTLDLASLRGPETASLRLYALADLCRCMCTRGRLPVFHLTAIDPPSPRSTSSLSSPEPQPAESDLSTLLLVPVELGAILCQICFLSSASPALPPDDLLSRAAALERATTAFTPSMHSPTADELWRQATLITLYQRLHRVGPLHPALRASRKMILGLMQAHVGPAPKGYAFPLFLAGTLSIEEDDRAAIRARWVASVEKGWDEAMENLEGIWREMDEGGHTLDWCEVLERQGRAVAFF